MEPRAAGARRAIGAKGLATLGEPRSLRTACHDLTPPWALVTLPRSQGDHVVAGRGSMPGWRGLAASFVLLLLTAFAAVPEAQPAGDPPAAAPPFGHEFPDATAGAAL